MCCVRQIALTLVTACGKKKARWRGVASAARQGGTTQPGRPPASPGRCPNDCDSAGTEDPDDPLTDDPDVINRTPFPARFYPSTASRWTRPASRRSRERRALKNLTWVITIEGTATSGTAEYNLRSAKSALAAKTYLRSACPGRLRTVSYGGFHSIRAREAAWSKNQISW
jgi:hypothetical protein